MRLAETTGAEEAAKGWLGAARPAEEPGFAIAAKQNPTQRLEPQRLCFRAGRQTLQASFRPCTALEPVSRFRTCPTSSGLAIVVWIECQPEARHCERPCQLRYRNYGCRLPQAEFAKMAFLVWQKIPFKQGKLRPGCAGEPRNVRLVWRQGHAGNVQRARRASSMRPEPAIAFCVFAEFEICFPLARLG